MAGLRLACGSLAVVAAAACSGGGAPPAPPADSGSSPMPEAVTASSGPPASSTDSASWPAPTTSTVRELTAPVRASDPQVKGTVTVRFVSYGDADPDDGVPFGVVPHVKIAVISEEDLSDWWATVGGNDLGIYQYIPPGARVQSTAEKLASAPAHFVTTGPDGTVEIPIDYTRDSSTYQFCAISPIVDDLIAGCNPFTISISGLWRPEEATIQIYFAYGHATVKLRQADGDRYQQLIDGSEISEEPATVSIIAAMHDDIGPSLPGENVQVAIVDSAHVNTWWRAISDDGSHELDMERLGRAGGLHEVLSHDWIRVITTSPDGLAETTLPPSDYLFCEVTWGITAGCIYEIITSKRDHFIGIDFFEGGNTGSIQKLPSESLK